MKRGVGLPALFYPPLRPRPRKKQACMEKTGPVGNLVLSLHPLLLTGAREMFGVRYSVGMSKSKVRN